MRTNWLLGIALGIFIGGFALEAGILALLAAFPALVWGLRSKARAAAISGLLVGSGIGQIGLIGLEQMRCTNVSGPDFGSFCTPPDLTPYLIEALVLAAVGLAIGLATVRRTLSKS